MRIIDADEYKRILNVWLSDMHSGMDECENAAGQAIFDCLCQLDDMPTVDAVEVVRCEDCLYWDAITKFCHCHSKYYDGGRCWDTFKHDDFCSYGERKEGDD